MIAAVPTHHGISGAVLGERCSGQLSSHTVSGGVTGETVRGAKELVMVVVLLLICGGVCDGEGGGSLGCDSRGGGGLHLRGRRRVLAGSGSNRRWNLIKTSSSIRHVEGVTAAIVASLQGA